MSICKSVYIHIHIAEDLHTAYLPIHLQSHFYIYKLHTYIYAFFYLLQIFTFLHIYTIFVLLISISLCAHLPYIHINCFIDACYLLKLYTLISLVLCKCQCQVLAGINIIGIKLTYKKLTDKPGIVQM